MAITFYNGSGSPFAWKVWLTLEHKQVPYEVKTLSFDREENKTPAFLALNSRGKVPLLQHGEVVVVESSAIVEYLEEVFPERPLLPRDPGLRAQVRQFALEADGYILPLQRRIFMETLFCKEENRDAGRIKEAQEALLEELGRWEERLSGEWLVGEMSLADFAVYPHIRLIRRVDDRQPANGLGERMPPRLAAWMKRIEALPYYERTIPPHWRA